MTTLELKYFNEASQFLTTLLTEVDSLGVDSTHWDIDHLCFRTESNDHYQDIKNEFASFSNMLIESPVNGRLIATFKLNSPWKFGDHFIDLIEVPAPKKGKVTKPGFEHIEVVIDKSFDELAIHYKNKFSFEDYSKPKFFNPELVTELKSGAIKFHHQSLENVINIEKIPNLLNSLEHRYRLPVTPFFITGTFPLEVNHEDSDIDICFEYSPEQQSRVLEFIQSFQEKVQSPRLKINGNVLIFSFLDINQQFEMYFAKEDIYSQNSLIHLQIEQRLLKIFGKKLKDKVIALKKFGLNTEWAFLKALNIDSNEEKAFQDIYMFTNKSDLTIWDMINIGDKSFIGDS